MGGWGAQVSVVLEVVPATYERTEYLRAYLQDGDVARRLDRLVEGGDNRLPLDQRRALGQVLRDRLACSRRKARA